MKASLKFREDQKPLFRAKVPLNILGFPFQSGIVAGESKELSLNLSSFFDAGPSLKVAYRPNDSLNPFSIVFKTGVGRFGSPISSSMTMSAEFSPIGNQNPRFFVHFKPRIGDFMIKKSQSSDFPKSVGTKSNGFAADADASVEVVDKPLMKSAYSTENGLFSGKKIVVLPSDTQAASLIGGFLSGMEVAARTALPVRQRAVVNFRWGLRVPPAEEAAAKANPTAGFSFRRFPLLVMNKIGIEHVAEDDSRDKKKVSPGLNPPENADVAEACITVQRQLEYLKAENALLRKSLDDLRSEIVAGKSAAPAVDFDLGKYREGERAGAKPSGGKADRRNSGDKKSSESNGSGGKRTETEVNEELKKALMGATGA